MHFRTATVLVASAIFLWSCGVERSAPQGASFDGVSTTRQALSGFHGGGVIRAPGENGWDSLSGGVIGDPAITNSGSNRVDVFVLGTNYAVYHRWWDGSSWNPGGGSWEYLGNNGKALDPPVAVARGDRIEVFSRERDTGHLLHRELSGATWTAWEDLQGVFIDKPTALFSHQVVSLGMLGGWAYDRIDVFVRAPDNTLWRMEGLGYGSWGGWQGLGGCIISPPAAVSWGDNRTDLIVRGGDNHLYHMYQDTGHDFTPGAFEPLGGSAAATPSVVSWGPNRLDIFATSADDTSINHLAFDGRWEIWEPVASGYAWRDPRAGSAPPVAVAAGVGDIRVFVQGGDRALYASATTGFGPPWASWSRVGDCFRTAGAPAVVARDFGTAWSTVDLVVTGWDGAAWHTSWGLDGYNFPNIGQAPPACPSGQKDSPCGKDNACEGSALICNPFTQYCRICGGATDLCCAHETCTVGYCRPEFGIEWCDPDCGWTGKHACGSNQVACKKPGDIVDPQSGNCVHCGLSGELGCPSNTPGRPPLYCLDPLQEPDRITHRCVDCGGPDQPECFHSLVCRFDPSEIVDGYCRRSACGQAAGSKCCFSRVNGNDFCPGANLQCSGGKCMPTPDDSNCGENTGVAPYTSCCHNKRPCQPGLYCRHNQGHDYCVPNPSPSTPSQCPGGGSPQQVNICAKCSDLVMYALSGFYCNDDDAKALATAYYPGCEILDGDQASVCPRD